MRRAIATAVATAALAAVLPHGASAQGLQGWDGKNPFACTLQQLGQGTDFPEPNADPFCVEYDKRHQNVDKLGVVDFLSKEPARVAAAGPKCFYFQRDHWVGSLIEGNQQTQTYAWDGSYYYDKSKGSGGVYVENFSINGQSGDPTRVPGFPSQYKPYFGEGRGGFRADNQVPVDQSCVAKAKQHDPYVHPGGAGSGRNRCRVPGGQVDHGIGGIRLGQTRRSVRHKLGPPTKESLLWVDYCMTGGGRLVAAFSKKGKDGRVVLAVTNSPPFDLRGIRTGDSTSKAHQRLNGEYRMSGERNHRPLAVRESDQTLLVGTFRGRVMFVAVAQPKLTDAQVKHLLNTKPPR